MTKDQELRLALEEIRTKSVCQTARTIAKDALRKALEQPEPEPVAWMDEFGNTFPLGAQRGPKYLNEPMKPLYTSTPKRKPLTNEMVKRMKENCSSMEMRGAFADGWLSAEAAHGIKE